MSSAKEISVNSYSKLLFSIRKDMAYTVKVDEQQRVRTYWIIGQHISQYFSRHEDLEGQIGKFYKKLSKDLDISDRTLQHSVQFFHYFPKFKIEDGLSWSHYRYLLTVPEKKERVRWFSRAVKNKWSATNLRLRLLETRSTIDVDMSKVSLDKSIRGCPYIYRVVHMTFGNNADQRWYVDCGFANRIDAPQSATVLDNKRFYRSVKMKTGYQLKIINALAEELYTFRARLLRVVDGDTLLVAIDQGFGVWTQQRLRLRGIDAPEKNTLAGKKAKFYVEQCLKGLEFIIVKTCKTDKYDRYLADVFYMPGEEDIERVSRQGMFLNQQLLDEGFAQIFIG